MALDGVLLSLVKDELKEVLIDGRVDKIHQPSKEEILFAIRTREKAYKLLFNTSAGAARVHITNAEIENPKVPPMFCMLMRKHLSSGKLVDIRQDGFERILYFDFDSSNEMGDMCRYTLAIEIMSRRSNLILINSDGKIIDSIKRVGHDMSSVRMVLPGMEYTVPPRDIRLSIFDFKRDELTSSFSDFSKEKLPKGLLKIFEGISPVFAREIEFYALKGEEKICGDLTEDDIDRIVFYINKVIIDIKNHDNKYTVLKTKEGKLSDFCFTSILQYGALMVTSEFENACDLLDYFYTARDETARTKQRANDLFKLLITLTERTKRRIEHQRKELLECKDRDKLKLYADLIMANIYNMKKGDAFVKVQDYTKDDYPTIKIKLDKRLTPSQNAQKYYSEYRKADTAEKMLLGLIREGEDEYTYLNSVFDSLTRAKTETDVIELRIELKESGYIKNSRLKGKAPKSLPPLKFISTDGYEILVGRNNKQNDKLALKDSDKNDIWLHTQKITGSHTVIKCNGETPPDSTIEQAAIIAAYHSSAKDSSTVPVDYTLIRYVKKPNGAKPGMVIFTNNKTIFITPDEEKVLSLKVK